MNFEQPQSVSTELEVKNHDEMLGVSPEAKQEPDRAQIFDDLAQTLGVDQSSPEGMDAMLNELSELRRLLEIRREGLDQFQADPA